jgi:hypothetical protein
MSGTPSLRPNRSLGQRLNPHQKVMEPADSTAMIRSEQPNIPNNQLYAGVQPFIPDRSNPGKVPLPPKTTQMVQGIQSNFQWWLTLIFSLLPASAQTIYNSGNTNPATREQVEAVYPLITFTYKFIAEHITNVGLLPPTPSDWTSPYCSLARIPGYSILVTKIAKTGWNLKTLIADFKRYSIEQYTKMGFGEDSSTKEATDRAKEILGSIDFNDPTQLPDISIT